MSENDGTNIFNISTPDKETLLDFYEDIIVEIFH